jgi:SNF2 family DNA or RNA helicase
MGLGKTIQIIAFILSQRKNGAYHQSYSSSYFLLFNWQEEISRFALPSKFCSIMELTDLKQLLISEYEVF